MVCITYILVSRGHTILLIYVCTSHISRFKIFFTVEPINAKNISGMLIVLGPIIYVCIHDYRIERFSNKSRKTKTYK